MTIRDIAIAFGYDLDKASEKKVNDSVHALKATATKLLGAIGIGFSLIGLKNISEEFGGINDQIRDATRGMGEQSDIQQTVLKYANETRQSYKNMADAVGKLAQNKDVFGGVDDAANFASLLYKNFMAAGKSAEASDALVKQMTVSISKGVVDSRAMMSLFRESPGTLRMLADSLGVSMDSLQDMVNKGQVSAKTLRDVFLKNAGAIEGRFGELDLTISDALVNIRNQWGNFVAKMDSTLGITKTIARFMVNGFNKIMFVLKRASDMFVKLGNRVGGIDRLMKLIAISAGAIFLALKAEKVISGLGKINLKMIAITAVIIAAALLIEDLINFMQGNDSLMGELFKKFGIDGDAVRETIQGILDTVKGLLPFVLDLIKRLGAFLMDIGQKVLPLVIGLVMRLIPFLISIIKSVLPVVISNIAMLLPFLFKIIEAILPVVISLIAMLLPFLFKIIEAILPIALNFIEMLLPLIIQIVQGIMPLALSLIEAILPILEPIIGIVMNLVIEFLPLMISLLGAILPILEPILGILKPIADVLGVIIGGLGSVVGKVGNFIGGLFGGGKGNSNADSVTLRDIAMLGAAPRPSTAAAAASSMENKSVTQNVEINNVFNGDRAGQQKSAAAMEKSADDATDVLARGLAYAR